MAGEVRKYRRAYRGIGADPVTVIWPGSNPAQWSLLQVLSPASRTFTSTLDGWTPPDRRVAALTPPTEPIAQMVGCMARAVG